MSDFREWRTAKLCVACRSAILSSDVKSVFCRWCTTGEGFMLTRFLVTTALQIDRRTTSWKDALTSPVTTIREGGEYSLPKDNFRPWEIR